MTLRNRLALAFGSGAVGALAFPQPGLWPLSFVAWAPLLVVLHRARARDGALFGFVAGVAFFGVALRWLIALTVLGWVALSVAMAAYLAAFGAATAVLLARPRVAMRVAVPATWVALEWIRGWLFTGFGWAAVGYSLAPAPRLLQLAALGGVPLLSFAIIGCNQALASAWCARERNGWTATRVPLAVAAGVIVLMLAHGSWVLSRPLDSHGELRAAVVQADMDPDAKWARGGAYESGQRYVRLTDEAARARPQLIVWPETAIPAPLDGARRLQLKTRGLRRRVREHWGAPLLFGVPERAPGTRNKFYNTAVLYPLRGEPPPAYRKRRLVPFGEYRPELLSFIGRVDRGPEAARGDGGRPFDVNGAWVAVLICFEDVFPSEGVARSADADVLAVITNDGWFGASGIAQHFDIAVLRAVETRRSIVRAANTGISALIDPRGRVLKRAPAGQSFAVGSVPLMRDTTVYARAPDLVPMLALAGALVALGFAIAARRQRDRS